MPSHTSPVFVFASADPALLAAIEPQLLAAGARVEIVLSRPRRACRHQAGPNPPGLALIDASLPGMATGQLLAAARAHSRVSRACPSS